MSKIVDNFISEEMGGVVLLPEYWLRKLLCYISVTSLDNNKLQSMDPIGGYRGESNDDYYDVDETWVAIEIGCTFEKGTIIFKSDEEEMPSEESLSYIPQKEEFEVWLNSDDLDFVFDTDETRALELVLLDTTETISNAVQKIDAEMTSNGVFQVVATLGNMDIWVTTSGYEGLNIPGGTLKEILAKHGKVLGDKLSTWLCTIAEDYSFPVYSTIRVLGYRGYVVINCKL